MTLGDGARTTLHVASYERRAFRARVEVLERPTPLVRWCDQAGVRDAVVGGFFSRPRFVPLGQVQVNGQPRPSLAFDSPWGDVRACVQITDGEVRIARRDQLGPAPAGDLLQAGPLLVAGSTGGRSLLVRMRRASPRGRISSIRTSPADAIRVLPWR